MQVEPGLKALESAWFQRLKLTYDEPLSNRAFSFNVRPYAEGPWTVKATSWAAKGEAEDIELEISLPMLEEEGSHNRAVYV